jgi:transposase
LRTKFHRLSKPELEFLIENCNFTEDENILLMMASRRYSDIQIADKLNISMSSVTKWKRRILCKSVEFLSSDFRVDNVDNVDEKQEILKKLTRKD